ncbi:MAG: RNA polymerase sigma factor [Gemmataceae bacterium]
MDHVDSTCWTVIRAAAEGDRTARDLFARQYEPVIRTYLAARWRGNPLANQADDVVQDVFVEFFKPTGVLNRADASFEGGFRALLYGVVRNVARRVEARPKAIDQDLGPIPSDDTALSRVFDRAWATAIMKAAAEKQAEIAKQNSPAAVRRVELLQLRFQMGMPIRDIARLWNEPAEQVHREYAKARDEFRDALRQVVAFHQPGTPESLERTVSELLSALA